MQHTNWQTIELTDHSDDGVHPFPQPVWSVSRVWQLVYVLVAASVGQLCFICQLLHHCVIAAGLHY